MKSNAVKLSNYFYGFLFENPRRFHHCVLAVLVSVIFLMFVFFSINFQMLIFLFSGYLCAIVGYHFAKRMESEESTTHNFRKHYRLIAENLNDIVIIYRLKDGKNNYVNTAVNTTLGFNPKELIGQPTIFMIHPEDHKKVFFQLNGIEDQINSSFVEKVRLRCKNGDFKWMELTFKTLENKSGKKNYAIIKLRDISATIELEKATMQIAEELFVKYMNYENVNSRNIKSTIVTSS